MGTLVAVDADTRARRDAILHALLQDGVDIAGAASRRFARDPVTLDLARRRVFLDALERVLDKDVV